MVEDICSNVHGSKQWVKDFYSKCELIRSFLWICSQLLKNIIVMWCWVRKVTIKGTTDNIFTENFTELFCDGGPYHIEASPLNQYWFLYDRDFVMKDLTETFCFPKIISGSPEIRKYYKKFQNWVETEPITLLRKTRSGSVQFCLTSLLFSNIFSAIVSSFDIFSVIGQFFYQ